mmetsp:Transcript_24301/g.75263  ORF Transcript_24301/g.75263 Transcript_24301/m.75263 type:complete len:266 (-) Transcript_24301:629-1426(-)
MCLCTQSHDSMNYKASSATRALGTTGTTAHSPSCTPPSSLVRSLMTTCGSDARRCSLNGVGVLPMATPRPAHSSMSRSFQSLPIATTSSRAMPWRPATAARPEALDTSAGSTSSHTAPESADSCTKRMEPSGAAAPMSAFVASRSAIPMSRNCPKPPSRASTASSSSKENACWPPSWSSPSRRRCNSAMARACGCDGSAATAASRPSGMWMRHSWFRGGAFSSRKGTPARTSAVAMLFAAPVSVRHATTSCVPQSMTMPPEPATT